MSEFTIYHNPRCSKSRQTLALLREHGVEPTIVLYLESPLSCEAIHILLRKLGVSASALLRCKEAQAVELGLTTAESDAETIINAMAEHPVLIERPIVVHGDQAVLGRPPENVLSLL